MRKVLLRVFLVLAGIASLLYLLQPYYPNTPYLITLTAGTHQALFGGERTQVLFPFECLTVYWDIPGAETIEFDDNEVAARGSGQSCAGQPEFDVDYTDGTEAEYLLERRVLLDDLPARVALVVVIGVVVAAGLSRVSRANAGGSLPHDLTLPPSRQGDPPPPRIQGRGVGSGVTKRKPSQSYRFRLMPMALRLTPCEGGHDARDWFAVTAIILVGLVLRGAYLSQPVRFDEARTFLDYVIEPFGVMLTEYDDPNNHLFHTLLVYGSNALFGQGTWSLRLPAFLAGLLIIPATYRVGRAFFNRETGLLAAGLVAASPILTLYSTNARGYTLITLIFLLLLLLARRALRRGRWRDWSLLAVVAAFGFYTIPVMLLPYGIVMLWLLVLLPRQDWRQRIRWLVSGVTAAVLTVLLYLPVIYANGLDDLVANNWVTASSAEAFAGDLGKFFGDVWEEWHLNMPLPLTVLLGGGFVLTLLLHRRAARDRAPLLRIGVIWLVVVTWLQLRLPPERVWLFALPLYFIGACAGLVMLARWVAGVVTRRSAAEPPPAWVGAVAVVAVLLTVTLSAAALSARTVFLLEDTGFYPDSESITQLLTREMGEDDRLLCIFRCINTSYYFYIYGIDDDIYIIDEGENADNRLFLLVRRDKETIDEVVEGADVERDLYAAPEQVASFEFVDVYELQRIVSGDEGDEDDDES